MLIVRFCGAIVKEACVKLVFRELVGLGVPLFRKCMFLMRGRCFFSSDILEFVGLYLYIFNKLMKSKEDLNHVSSEKR